MGVQQEILKTAAAAAAATKAITEAGEDLDPVKEAGALALRSKRAPVPKKEKTLAPKKEKAPSSVEPEQETPKISQKKSLTQTDKLNIMRKKAQESLDAARDSKRKGVYGFNMSARLSKLQKKRR